jgi:hypothetical protein
LIAIAAALTVPAIRAVPDADPVEPVGAAASGAGASGQPTAGSRVAPRARLPWSIVLVLAAASFLTGLTNAQLVPGGPLIVLGLVVGIPAFRALTPPGTLRAAAGIPAAVMTRGILTFAFFAADAFVPLAIHDWRGFSAIVAGIALTAATLAWTTGAWIQARRHVRWGARRMVTLGFGALMVGIAGFGAILAPEVPIGFGIVAWAIAGLGMGFAYAPLTLVILAEAPPGTEGAASAGLQLSDVLGVALGTGIGGAIIAAAVSSGSTTGVGLAGTFILGLGVAVIGIGLARRLPGPRATAVASHPDAVEPSTALR